MILVGKYPSIKVQNATHSLFVKFDYDAEKVAKIKSLPVRFYEPNNKVWEVPMSDMDRVVNLFGVENIRIFNEFPEFEQYLRIREQKAKNAKSVDELIAYYENLKPEVEYNFKTKPDGHQIESFNTALHLDSLFITDAMGLGKAQPLYSKILTPVGWTTMGDIKVGDNVIGKDGKPHKVLGVFDRGIRHIFELTFNDGSKVRCCNDHLWRYKTYYHQDWILGDLNQMIKDFNRVQRIWIPMVNPVEFTPKSVTIDPYVLGVLLGDGGFRSGYVGITSSDQDIIDEVNKRLPNNHICEKIKSTDYGYIIKSLDPCRTVNGNIIKNELKSYGIWKCLSNDKYVPNDYIYNTVEVRLSVLKGLMDTDGYIGKNGVTQFYSTSYQLALDAQEIIQSLGGIARLKECHGSYKKDGTKVECKKYYMLTINMPDHICPFSLKRKVELYNKLNLEKKYKPTRIIRDIFYIGKEECRCISVDSNDHLYITDDYVVTHNTKQAIDICDYKKHVGLAKHVLIVCGANGLKYNWMEEIKKHSWNNCQVIDGTTTQRLEKLMGYWKYFYNIINIESIRNNAKFDKKGNLIKENDNPILNLLIKLCDSGKFEVIVVDEFHKANNHKSQQGLGLRCLKAKYKIALSGTPITKRIERAWSILNWMGLETAKYWDFVKRYCVLGGFSGWEPTGEYKNLDELHERFDRFQIRRTKDILKLPPKVHKYVYVDMNTDEHNEYMDIKRGIIRDVESGDIKQINPAVATVKLRLFTDKIKARAIKEIIEELQDNDNPCVIFSMYKEGLYTLQKELAEYNPLLLTGDITSASKKQEIINAFQEEKRSDVLMGTIQAMGTGYTLTRSQYVVFLNKMWICTDNEQAEDRCHRRGTTGSVTVISVIVKNSIDERVEEILANDKMYIDKVVDGIPVFKMSNRQIFNKLMED